MVTNSAQHGTTAIVQPATGLLTRAVDQVRQFVCGLHGHDALLHFGPGRLSLHCTSCGYETPGWDVNGANAAEHAAPATRVVRMPLVRQRRAA